MSASAATSSSNRPHQSPKPCGGDTGMSQSLANIVVHLGFSTKGRRQLLRDEEHAFKGGL
jgi:hypothetical protein